MRAFLSSSTILALFLTTAAPLLLTGCDKADDKKTEKKAEEKKSVEVDTAADASKVSEEKKSEKKAEEKSEAPKGKGTNLKVDHETEEPALVALAKLDPNAIVARVEGEEITVAQLIETIKISPDQVKNLPLSKVYVAMVKRLRDMRALVKAAEKDGVDQIPEVQKRELEAKEAVRVKHFVDKKINEKITPEYLKKQFDEFMKIYKKDGKSEKEFRLQVIVVKDKKAAEDAITRLKKGEKFDELVAELSTDDKVKETKGELGYVRFSELPKELAEKIQKAATGIVVQDAVELGKDRWAVFKKLDQRDLPDPTFAEVEQDLKKVVTPQFFATVLKEVLEGLKTELIDYKTGTPLDEKAEEEKAKAALAEAQKEAGKGKKAEPESAESEAPAEEKEDKKGKTKAE